MNCTPTPDRRARVPIHQLAVALGLAFAGTAHAAWDCPSLVAVTTADATVTSAAITNPPATIGGAAVAVPFCRVQARGAAIDRTPRSSSRCGCRPPRDDWTGRMKVNGTGGYAGAIPYARLAQDIGDGIVTAGSNMGHDGGESASWTLGHPEKVKDWGLRAHFSVATAAKALSQAFYGAPVRYSYFEGCSNGGRQALMMAQNYPQLFNGIVAGAPSNFYPDLLMWLLWTGKNLTPSAPFGPPSVSPAKRLAVTQRVLQACDGNDGLVDGQITNPRACRFDIDSMGPAGDGTLTAAELAVVQGDVCRHHQRGRRAALHRRATGLGERLESAVRRQRRLRPVHRPLRVLAREPAVRLAARHQLLQRLRPRQAGADAGHRGAEPGPARPSRGAAARSSSTTAGTTRSCRPMDRSATSTRSRSSSCSSTCRRT